jgi:alanine racemase
VSSPWQLAIVGEAARSAGRRARIHLKIDTGLSRNGSTREDWPELLRLVAKTQATDEVEVVGIWSHFAYADEPGHPTIGKQISAFHAALEVAASAGIEPHFDLVRPGIAMYGLSPVPGNDFGLTPAMTLRSSLASVKRVRAGEGVSYGHAYTTEHDTTIALIPLGYADGVPRHATNAGPVSIDGRRYRIAGRVCMDQIMVDVGDAPIDENSTAVLFGTGRNGEPTAQDWADVLGTIHYEVVTRIGPRVPRVYVDGASA